MRRHRTEALASVLAQCGHVGTAKVTAAKIISKSTQAHILLVGLEGQENPLVVKLFKPDRLSVQNALNDEFESLGLMSQVFDGLVIDDWRILAPQPLFKCEDPPALMMTMVSGVTLENILRRGDSSWVENLVGPISESLHRYWSACNRIIGDFNLSNILCDAQEHVLAFVDPGIPQERFRCPSVANKFFPASRDLAYLLFEVSLTNVRVGAIARKRAARRESFATGIVRRYARDHVDPTDALLFLGELRSCSAIHLQAIGSSGGMKRPWKRFVWKHGGRRLRAHVDTLEWELGRPG